MVAVGTQSGSFSLGPTSKRKYDTLDLNGRSEWLFRVAHALDLRLGLDVDAEYLEGEYVGEQPPQLEGSPQSHSFGTERLISLRDAFWLVSPAAYVEMSVRPGPRVLLVPGVRVDYFDQLGRWSVDPRLGARWQVGPTTTLKGGVGLFTQPPQYWEALVPLGNPDLSPYHALHTSLGVEQSLGESVELDVEAFHKRIFDRVVQTEGGEPPRFENDGVGRIHGAELGATVRPAPTTFATLSYTLSRSERRGRNGPWRLFDSDQTHVLSVAANQDLGRGWELGARFRTVTGNPTTPVVAAQYDANHDLYRPIYGDVNSIRSPAFHQLDVRVEKTWRISDLSISAYLELMNAYNAQNQEGVRYGFDYSKSEPVTGVPIFPNLGVRGEI
jgi:hypothetical protein